MGTPQSRLGQARDRRLRAPKSLISPGYRCAKRTLDIIGALLALVILALPMLLVALVIRLESRGPALFWQYRLGENGLPFRLFKFRSMRVDAEQVRPQLESLNEVEGPAFKIRRDPRLTRIGSFLRKSSFDETPQFFHVLLGQMSLVGPRPCLLNEVRAHEPWQRQRLAARPGLTCIWQITGRSDIPFERWVGLDIEYVRRRSFWFDLSILVRTIPAVLSGRGAY